MKLEVYLDDAVESELMDKITTVVKNALLEYGPQAQSETPAYLNQGQCAKYLGVSRTTLYKFIRMGLKTTMIGDVTRIKKVDADTFMAKHQI